MEQRMCLCGHGVSCHERHARVLGALQGGLCTECECVAFVPQPVRASGNAEAAKEEPVRVLTQGGSWSAQQAAKALEKRYGLTAPPPAWRLTLEHRGEVQFEATDSREDCPAAWGPHVDGGSFVTLGTNGVYPRIGTVDVERIKAEARAESIKTLLMPDWTPGSILVVTDARGLRPAHRGEMMHSFGFDNAWERAGKLSDECGALKSDNTALLAENARLRRALERKR